MEQETQETSILDKYNTLYESTSAQIRQMQAVQKECGMKTALVEFVIEGVCPQMNRFILADQDFRSLL